MCDSLYYCFISNYHRPCNGKDANFLLMDHLYLAVLHHHESLRPASNVQDYRGFAILAGMPIRILFTTQFLEPTIVNVTICFKTVQASSSPSTYTPMVNCHKTTRFERCAKRR